MVRPIRLVQIPEGSASSISLHMEGAVIKSAASPENCLLTAQVAQGKSADDQLEAQFLIEMRYAQHLAQQGLQELFESGELGFL